MAAGRQNLFSLDGHVALVTGASSGLGRRAATVLADAGASVIGVARRAEALESWVAEGSGNRAALPADLSDESGVAAMCEAASGLFARPIFWSMRPASICASLPRILRQMTGILTQWLNLGAPFFISQKLVPAMKERGWGRIVNFASLQTTRAFPSGIAYGASKGGVGQMTRAMAEAWSGDGINTNAIGPGFFPTELTAAVFADEARAARNATQTCIGRNGRLEDIDGPLLFLCSDASVYVTGQVLMVDGGFTAK